MTRYTLLVTFCLAFALALGSLSCSSKRKPPEQQQAPPTTAQRKEAQAERLKGLAANVAKEVQGAMLQREDLVNLPIFVRPPLDTRFSQTFSRLLVSELVSRGIEVSIAQENALVLDYNLENSTVLTVSLRYNNRYVMHTSKVAYVGDQGMGRFAKDAVWNRYAKRRPVYEP